jgi:hypothetical protein
MSNKSQVKFLIYTKKVNELYLVFNSDSKIPEVNFNFKGDNELLGFPTFNILKTNFGLETEYIDRIRLFKLKNKSDEEVIFLIVKIDDISRVNPFEFKIDKVKSLDKLLQEQFSIVGSVVLE